MFKNYKWITILSILLIAVFALAACAPAATEAPATEAPAKTEAPVKTEAPAKTEEAMPEKTEEAVATEEPMMDPWADVDPTGQTITFWHQHTSGRETALNEIVQAFNDSNPYGITVVAEYQGGYGDIFNKMLTFMNTSDVGNIVVAYQNQAATYQLGDALVDMNPLVDSEKWGLSLEEQRDFFQGFYAQDVFPNFGNARLGFPPNRSMEVLYYNMDWLAELGYDAPPASPAEFKEMACAASATPFSKATAEGNRGYELSLDASRFASWTFAFGGDVFNYVAGEYSYNNDAAKAAMSFLQELFDEGCATIVTESYGDQTNFGQGTTLFTVGSSSGLPFYGSAVDAGSGHEWSIGAIPHTTKDPVMNIYGASVSIPKTTPEAELAAWLFLKYYTSPEVQAEWVRISEYFPVRASVAAGLTDYFAESPNFKIAFDMLQYGYFEPPTPGYDFVRDMVRESMAAIADGADVNDTLTMLTEDANVSLAEQLEQMAP